MSQQAVASQIMAICRRLAPTRGLPGTAMGVGLICNGYAESSLDPTVVVMDSNRRYSRGLWQFNDAGMAAELRELGMTNDQMLDVEYATGAMIAACSASGKVMLASSGSLADLTRAITIYVEKPSDAENKAAYRVTLIKQLFGMDPSTPCWQI